MVFLGKMNTHTMITRSKAKYHTSLSGLMSGSQPPLFNFGNTKFADLITVFALQADGEGYLSKQQYSRTINSFLKTNDQSQIDTLFQILSSPDRPDYLEFLELMCVLSAFSSLDIEEPMRQIFKLLDVQDSGYITANDLTYYINSIFKVCYHFNPQLKKMIGKSEKDLASLTVGSMLLDLQGFSRKKVSNITQPQFIAWLQSPF